MNIFDKYLPKVAEAKEVKETPDAFLVYCVRKLCGCKTDEAISAKLQSLRVSMLADEQRRLADEAKVKEKAEGVRRQEEADLALCHKHLGHMHVYFCPTATYAVTRPQFVDIPEDFKVTCPECGMVVDVSKEVLKAAQRYEDAGARIEAAIADAAFERRGIVFEASIFRVAHHSIYNGMLCGTVIEVVIKGCRKLGERRA